MWPEMAQLCLESDGCHGELLLVLPGPLEIEISAVESGRVRFAWVDSERVALLAFRFDDGLDWSDAPYTPNLEAAVDGSGGTCAADGRLMLRITLVDGNTGVVRAVRHTSWPAPFAHFVRNSAARLCRAGYSDSAAGAEQDSLYAHFRTTADMVRRRADAACIGLPAIE
ncbi:hypothetical protein GCM10027167_41380 [Nocardia heshunensis]